MKNIYAIAAGIATRTGIRRQLHRCAAGKCCRRDEPICRCYITLTA
ncbi:MAG: hypothetical protein MZV63_51870 [Marinilabiliales bacterium]|nr:hypothetical protein [Marinilabiliales bacterium]